MNWRKPFYFALLGLLLILLAPWAAARAAERSVVGSHFVRIPAATVEAASGLGLNPRLAVDYGSFHWLEISSADLAKLAASGLNYTVMPDAAQVQVTRFRFDPLAEGEPNLPAGMVAEGNGAGFRLVQLVGPTQDAWLAELEAAGLRVLQYYPHHAFLVWGTAGQIEAVDTLEFVRWTGAFHPGYKINTDLDQRAGVVENVDIFFYNDGDVEETLGELRALGATVLNAYPAQPDKAFYDAIVRADAATFAAIAQLNNVLWLGYAHPVPVLDDEISAQIVAGNHPGGVPVVGYEAHLATLGVDGTGVRWAVVDTGIDYQHPDLDPNIVGGYSFPGACNPAGEPGSDCPGQGHGSHVAGIVAGTGDGVFTDPNGFLYGIGVAPGAELFAMNSLSAAAWPPAGGWQEHSKQAVLGGAIGGNNSWTTGEGTAHGYQSSERTHDIMVHDGNFDTAAVAEPFIEVFSAGNSGPGAQTLTAPKEGKNLIIVASSLNYRAGNIDTISGFSSRGPAVDGRIGVTIATPGEDIISANNDTGTVCGPVVGGTNNLYVYCSGTSMAAPHASGSIALITEWWRSMAEGGADPSSAMAKALLVNGAVDMGTADIPNPNEGWGRVNFTNVIDPDALVLYYDQEDLFSATGEQVVLNVGVPDPNEPLKVTLAWADAPGAVGANPALVNNLNLTVVNDGNTYLGNVFSAGWSNTGGSADNLNNIENVFVQNPGGGATITIDAANISGDGVFYNGDATDQYFALVCYNCALSEDFSLSATPTNLEVCAPADAVYTVEVGSILGYDDTVTLTAQGNPAGTTVNFSVNAQPAPYTSMMTIGNTGAATAGSYDIDIIGTAPTSTHTTTVGLDLYDDVPGTVTLVAPADGATGVTLAPTYQWNAATQGIEYLLEVADDAGFTNIVYSAVVEGTSHQQETALDPLTTYYWRVTPSNICGSGSTSATFDFTTADIPPILLVDDDDNSPDVQATYTSAMDNLGLQYDIWDTANSDTEPSASELAPYELVIWFSGDEFGGFAGPGSATETALASWLDQGNCFFISSQDYHYDRGMTPFMTNYLGAGTITDDDGDYTSVTGTGSVFGGLGPYSLTYPFTDYSDPITPGGSAELAFDGNNGSGAAVNKDNGTYRTTFWVFPWEAIGTAGGREEALQTVLDWCGADTTLPADIAVTPENLDASQPPDTQTTQTLTISNNGDADLEWEIIESETVVLDMTSPAGQTTLANTESLFASFAPNSGVAATNPSGSLLPSESGAVSLVLDDGTPENAIGLTAGGQFIWLNRFTPAPSDYPFTLEQVEVMFRSLDGVNVGETVDIYVYSDADGNPANGATFVGSSTGVTVQVLDAFSVYPVSMNLTGPGDVLIGVVNRTAGTDPGEFVAAIDQTASQGRSWVGLYGGNPGDPPALPAPTFGTIDSFGFPGNWMVRGSGTIGGGGGGCTSTDIPWLSVSPDSGTTAGGASTDVDVTFDSTGLATGVYTATLCVNSNDADTPQIAVPVEMTVFDPTYGVQSGTADADLTGEPGSTVTYTVSITNTGDATDTFDLTLSGNSWTSDLSETSVTLDAGESTTVWITVEIPGDATDGETDTVTVTAESVNDPTATSSVDLTTTADVVVTGYVIYLPVIVSNGD
jgi:hypothetical protein